MSLLTSLQPFANTMSQALLDSGITPPSELGDLTQTFHDNIVDPLTQAKSSVIPTNVLNFLTKSAVDYINGSSQSPTDKAIGQSVTQSVSNDSMFNDPILWFAILAIIVAAYFILR